VVHCSLNTEVIYCLFCCGESSIVKMVTRSAGEHVQLFKEERGYKCAVDGYVNKQLKIDDNLRVDLSIPSIAICFNRSSLFCVK
jgi:hypothetical protein